MIIPLYCPGIDVNDIDRSVFRTDTSAQPKLNPVVSNSDSCIFYGVIMLQTGYEAQVGDVVFSDVVKKSSPVVFSIVVVGT